VLFSIDITESKKTQEAYQKVNIENRKLNKINELLDNIIFMTAHDLRSPISNLKLITHLISESKDMEEKLELLDKVTEITNRMENVINGLVEIIEVQKEGIDRPKKVSFQKVFEHVYAEYETKLDELNAKIDVDFSKAPEINYQEAFLISIFNNLIGNAIKYHSEKPLEITVSTENVPGFILLEISDNGIGIDLKKYYKTIFRPFSRIKDSQKEGKGIGLHLVKTIVEKNGGSIEVESEPGKGAKFTLYLAEY
jgi:two-component system, chemotaxis family, CheB/CheR fusion protein